MSTATVKNQQMEPSRPTKAALIAIGDELTCGYRLDTNSQYIARHLATVPLDVVLHLTVADTMPAIHHALEVSLAAADVIVATGGLGPTEDDLTRQAVAAYYDLELVEDSEALDRIRARFRHRNLSMPESNRIQAHVPAGSQIIQNERGTAPGFYLHQAGKHLFFTPGIPYEMEGMLEGFILPQLYQLADGQHHVLRAAVKTYGLPESKVNELLRPMMARDRNPLLGLLPHRGTITIELVATATEQSKAEALLEADIAEIRSQLGKYVISTDEKELPQVVADLLSERQLTIAVREIGTGGLVAAHLTTATGHKSCFCDSKVLPAELDSEPAPSESEQEEQAFALARAARQASGCDIGLGIGAITIAADSTPSRPYASIPIAVDSETTQLFRLFTFNGAPDRVREWAADAALALVRKLAFRLPAAPT